MRKNSAQLEQKVLRSWREIRRSRWDPAPLQAAKRSRLATSPSATAAALAVDDLSFEVNPGLVTGFIGPNGSRKTTTMRLILGLDNPTSGQVTVGGKPYRDLPAPLREIGALIDAKAVHPSRTAYHYLLGLAQSNAIPTSRIDEVLGMVGMEGVAGKRVGGFSLGMGQRLGIAGALLGDPPVLMFDEPLNGLDPEGIVWIRQLMNFGRRRAHGVRLQPSHE